MSRGRVLAIAGVAVLLVAAGVGGYMLWTDRQDDQICVRVGAERDDLIDQPFTAGNRADIYVIGDSYSQGTGLASPDEGWPAFLAQAMEATVTVDGQGSTGYGTTGYCDDERVTYGARVIAAEPITADVLVVQGSVNDAIFGDPDDVSATAAELLRDVESVPTVVLVGPPDIPAVDRDDLEAIDSALSEAASARDRVYVSLLDEDIEISDDEVHPTVGGQRRIAELTAAALADIRR